MSFITAQNQNQEEITFDKKRKESPGRLQAGLMTLALISIACISDVSSLQAMLIYARIIYAMDHMDQCSFL